MSEIALYFVMPLATALLLVLFGHWIERWAGAIVSAVFLLLTAVTVHLWMGVDFPVSIAVGGWTPIDGVPLGIHWVMDGLALLMLGVINLIGVVVAVYSIGSMVKFTKLRKYYALLLLLGLGMNGVILAGDFFTLYVFLEISAISSYILVAFDRGAEAMEASLKYQVLGGTASMLILMGIALIYRLTGTLNMADAARVLLGMKAAPTVQFVGVLFLAGFGVKAAIMPFHAWLPDAHPAAPAPVSALLSGVVVKVLGIYPLCRIFFHVIGFQGVWPEVWIVLGGVSLMAGNILALAQWDIKRLLAYCSVSQIGYIFLALGLGTPLGLVAGLFHLVTHAVGKALLFFNAGVIVHVAGNRDMRALGGMATQLPFTRRTYLISAFSVAGLPPFAGFWSKLFIIVACVEAGRPFWGIWAAIGSMLTLAAFLKIQKHVFAGEVQGKRLYVHEAVFSRKVSMVFLAVLCVLLGFLAIPALYQQILSPASEVLIQGVSASLEILRQ